MKTNKQVLANTKKEIKRLLADIENNAILKADIALSSGCISEDSEFRKINSLLALCVLEVVTERYKLKSVEFVKESLNIQRFIMKTLKALKKMLKGFPNKGHNLNITARNMFDAKVITYNEYIVLRDYILDNNL